MAGVLIAFSVLDSTSGVTWESTVEKNPWLLTSSLVAVPGQLSNRRGGAGPVALRAEKWAMERMCAERKVDAVTGQLGHFVLEPMVLQNDDKTVNASIMSKVPAGKRPGLASFILCLCTLTGIYTSRNYLGINPVVMLGDNAVAPVEMAAKIDETANFLALIRGVDGATGASLKLAILSEKGRVWTVVAGGGASVVYVVAVADYVAGRELANCSDYSGAPSIRETPLHAETFFSPVLKFEHPGGKIRIIVGGVANVADVAASFVSRRRGGIARTRVAAVTPAAPAFAAAQEEPDLGASRGPLVRKMLGVKDEGPGARQLAPPASERAIVKAAADATFVVYSLQSRAVQGMLGFDCMRAREKPSVSAVTSPGIALKFDGGTEDFIDKCKKGNQLVVGIGHRVMSLANPDMRAVPIKGHAKKQFKLPPILDFAGGGADHDAEECDELMSFGCLNGLFVLGRPIGFIGHRLDQLRLERPLCGATSRASRSSPAAV
ncbi:unnamed protein product, partial [Prorocentrum cordatum]